MLSWLVGVAVTSHPVRAEIPIDPDAPTSRDYAAAEARFFTRVVLEPYQAKHAAEKSTANKHDLAEQFLKDWIVATTKGYDEVDLEPLVNKGEQAASAGCEDPMFAYCYGRILREQGELVKSAKHLRNAVENLESAGYDASFVSWAASHLAGVLKDLPRHEQMPTLPLTEAEYLITTVGTGPYSPEEQQLLYRHMVWAIENQADPVAEAIVNAIDPIYPWLAHMAAGKLAIRRAWKARGGGWATEVKDEGWTGFEEHMAAARDHLTQAWIMNPQWPEAASEMITVAMAGHATDDETPRLWFERAVAAQIDYRPAYTALLWSLMPRWGGSHLELYQVGRECLDTGRFDTHIPYSFLQAFEYIVRDIGSDFDYYKTPGVYEDFQELADGYLAEPSMAWHHEWYRTLKVSVAVRCGKWDDAKQYLLALDHKPHEYAFTRLGLKMDDAIGEIHARTGDIAAANAHAEQLLAEGKYDEAAQKLKELASKSAGDQRTKSYFESRLNDLKFDRDFAAGKWTKLPLDAHLRGWRNLGGKWSIDAQGRLVGEAQTHGLSLMFEKRLGTQFDLRGKIVFLTKEHGQCNLGIYFGQHNGNLSNSLRIFPDQAYAALLDGNNPLARKDMDLGETSSFLVERRGNAITAFVNDELVCRDVEVEPYGPPANEVIALGGSYWYTGPIFRFEDFEIRKIEDRPSTNEDR